MSSVMDSEELPPLIDGMPHEIAAVKFINEMGGSVDTSSYRCVLDIFAGLSGTIFDVVSHDVSTGIGEDLGYIPKTDADVQEVQEVLAKYKTKEYGLTDSEIEIIDKFSEKIKLKSMDDMYALSEMCSDLDHNQHLKFILQSIIASCFMSTGINNQDGDDGEEEIDSDQLLESFHEIFISMNDFNRSMGSAKVIVDGEESNLIFDCSDSDEVEDEESS